MKSIRARKIYKTKTANWNKNIYNIRKESVSKYTCIYKYMDGSNQKLRKAKY